MLCQCVLLIAFWSSMALSCYVSLLALSSKVRTCTLGRGGGGGGGQGEEDRGASLILLDIGGCWLPFIWRSKTGALLGWARYLSFRARLTVRPLIQEPKGAPAHIHCSLNVAQDAGRALIDFRGFGKPTDPEKYRNIGVSI